MDCCHAPPGLEDMFDPRTAAREARRFVRRGLPPRARRLLALIRSQLPLEGATSLEVGGGAGGLSVQLLRDGIARAVIVDASAAYAEEARRLASVTGMADRLDAHHANYATYETDAAVDLVVMDRVVCCDPDWQGLLAPATRQARRAIALSYPRAAWWTALLVLAVNLGLRITRQAFRMQYHSPTAMLGVLRDAGFQLRSVGHFWMWELVVVTR